MSEMPIGPKGLPIIGTAELIHGYAITRVEAGQVIWAGETRMVDQETVKNMRTGERIWYDSELNPHKESDIDWKGLDINL